MKSKLGIMLAVGVLGAVLSLPAQARSQDGDGDGAARKRDDSKCGCKGHFRKALARLKNSDLSPERKREILQNLKERLGSCRHDRREGPRDRKEDLRDRKEDRGDRFEDRRDRRHDGGPRDKREDLRDRREDRRDKCEDRFDRRHPPKRRPGGAGRG